MKKITFCFLLLLPAFAHAQIRHEIKLDAFQSVLRSVFISYELAPAKHYGLEFGIGHKWDKLSFLTTQPDPEGYQSFNRNLMQVYLAGKWYFSKKANADRWFAGGYFLEEYEWYRDPAYEPEYVKNYGEPSAVGKNSLSGLGGQIGYKKVFRNNWLLELGFAMHVNVGNLFLSADQRFLDVGGFYQVKLGYTFPCAKPSEEKKE